MQTRLLTRDQILKHLPHRPPFLFVDEVLEMAEGEYIMGIKHIDPAEEFFKGHFPQRPIVPGVLIIEALAQTSCILYDVSLPAANERAYYLSSVKVRFMKPAIPSCQIELFSRAVKMVRQGGMFKVEAKIRGESIAEGEMTFACQDTG